jgi:excisionase family DNA binding protein
MSVTPVARQVQGEPGDIIRMPEACRILGVHRNTLYRLIQAGEVPAFKMIVGGQWRFRRRELEQWLEDKQGRAGL